MKQQPVKQKPALLGLLLLGASLFAHAGDPPAAAATLVYSWPVNAGPLDPRGYSPNQMYAQAMVYEPLVRYTASGTVEPWLAAAWKVSDDGKTYTFTLRDSVQFSDGTPFDAKAAKANLDAVLANSQRHRWMELVTTLDHIEAPDRLTLRLVLKHPYYPTLMELAQVRPLRFAAPVAKPGEAVGTGPWMRAESRLGEFDRFVRNPHYWGPAPAYGEVMVKVIPDPNSRALALQAGEIDLIQGAAGEITAGTFVRLRDQGFTTALSAPLATRTVAMNTGRGATQDLAVRRAINEAVDKQAIIDKILYGLEPRADTLFASNMPYSDIGLKPYPYDPALAAQGLDAAGWTLAPGASVRSKGGGATVHRAGFPRYQRPAEKPGRGVAGGAGQGRHPYRTARRRRRRIGASPARGRFRHDLRRHLGRAL